MKRDNKWSSVVWALLLAMVTVACGAQHKKPHEKPTAETAASVGVAASPDPLPPVVQRRVFLGPEGLRVDVLDLEGDQALVVVSGVLSELSGLALRHSKTNDGSSLRYQTAWHGRTLNTLVKSEQSSSEGSWKAYIPDASSDGFEIEYSQEASRNVDEQSILAAHHSQRADGSIDKIAAFDRAKEEAEEMAQLDEEAKRTSQECGHPVRLSVKWDTVDREQILSKSVAGYCGSVLSAVRNICRFEKGRRFVGEEVHSIECRLDGDHELDRRQAAWTWSIGFETYNLDQKAREALLATPAATGGTLQDQILAEQTTVCTDASGEHLVLWGPDDAPHHGMAYGSGKSLFFVPIPKALGAGWFLDPRQRNDQRNENFRGYDLRVYSLVEADPAKGSCRLTCGKRQVELSLLQGEAKENAMRGLQFEPSPHKREPYALARDSYGTYYYVDRGNTEVTARDFRLYRGKRGAVKPLKMKDVVSDSEGEIFSSDSGELRLLLQEKGDFHQKPEKAQWIVGRRATQLVTLPLVENYQLIYNELGVYLGEPLGLPCDDL